MLNQNSILFGGNILTHSTDQVAQHELFISQRKQFVLFGKQLSEKNHSIHSSRPGITSFQFLCLCNDHPSGMIELNDSILSGKKVHQVDCQNWKLFPVQFDLTDYWVKFVRLREVIFRTDWPSQRYEWIIQTLSPFRFSMNWWGRGEELGFSMTFQKNWFEQAMDRAQSKCISFTTIKQASKRLWSMKIVVLLLLGPKEKNHLVFGLGIRENKSFNKVSIWFFLIVFSSRNWKDCKQLLTVCPVGNFAFQLNSIIFGCKHRTI